MKVSDEMFEQMLNAFRCYVGNQKESLDASLAVLPEMYTLEQVEAMHNFLRARFAMPDKYARQSNIDDFIARLTQHTPAAPDSYKRLSDKYGIPTQATPEMYTVVEIITKLHREFQASTTWTNDRIAEFTRTFHERLTQPQRMGHTRFISHENGSGLKLRIPQA